MKKMLPFECEKCGEGFHIGEGKIFSPHDDNVCSVFTEILTLCDKCFNNFNQNNFNHGKKTKTTEGNT